MKKAKERISAEYNDDIMMHNRWELFIGKIIRFYSFCLIIDTVKIKHMLMTWQFWSSAMLMIKPIERIDNNNHNPNNNNNNNNNNNCLPSLNE